MLLSAPSWRAQSATVLRQGERTGRRRPANAAAAGGDTAGATGLPTARQNRRPRLQFQDRSTHSLPWPPPSSAQACAASSAAGGARGTEWSQWAVQAADPFSPGRPSFSHAAPDARALTRVIGGARDWQEVQQLYAAHGAAFDMIHVSAALVRLAALHGSGRDAGAANDGCAGGCSSSSSSSGGEAAVLAHDLAAALLDRAADGSSALTHRLAANMLWAAARLGVAPPAPRLRRLLSVALVPGGLAGFNSQELANLAYALALLEPLYCRNGAAADSSSSSSSSSAGSNISGRPWSDGFVLALFEATSRSLPRFNARDAAQAAYALALLRPEAPAGWLTAWARRADALLPEMSGQALANSAWAVARLLGQGGSAVDGPGAQDAAAARSWLGRALRYATLHAPALGARELIGQLFWAAAQLHDDDNSSVFAAIAVPPALLGRAAALAVGDDGSSSTSADHLAQLLHTMGQLGAPLPQEPWQARFWAALGGRLRRGGVAELSGPRLCDLLTGAAALEMQPPPGLRAVLIEHAAVAAEGRDPRAAARAVYVVAAMGWRPGQRWLTRFQTASRPLLSSFQPRDFANVIWALAKMQGGMDARWLEWFLVESLPQLPRFQPRELANTLWALAALDHRPAAAWIDALLAACAAALPSFGPRELTAVAWALARLNYRPEDAWLAAYLAAARPQLCEFDAPELAATARALLKLRAAPPPDWVGALSAEVGAKFGAFDASAAVEALESLKGLTEAAAGPEAVQAEVGGPAPSGMLAVAGLPRTGVVRTGSGALPRAAPELANPAGLRQGVTTPPPPAATLPLLEAFVAEAHGMAALMALMPGWLHARLRSWPRAWAQRQLDSRPGTPVEGDLTVVSVVPDARQWQGPQQLGRR